MIFCIRGSTTLMFKSSPLELQIDQFHHGNVTYAGSYNRGRLAKARGRHQGLDNIDSGDGLQESASVKRFDVDKKKDSP